MNKQGTWGDLWHKSDTACSANVPEKAPEIKNPGALSGATGVHENAFDGAREECLKRAARATALRALIDSCDPSDAALILSDALNKLRIGAPIPALMNAMDEARTWAEWATPDERKAYCLASFNAMPPKDQAGFLAYVIGRGAA